MAKCWGNDGLYFNEVNMTFYLNKTFHQLFVVSEETHKDFIKLSNDNNPLHINEQFAQSKGFKGIVVHGNILNAFISYFIGECLPTKDVIIHSQSIQFKKPVYLNTRLMFSAEVVGIYDSVNAVEFKFKFQNSEEIIVAKGNIQIGII